MAEALSLVERGWHGARECSLRLGRRGDRVLHLIKGRLEPETRALIAPATGVRCADVPRAMFRMAAWGALASRRWRWVLVDNPRTARAIAGWCRAFGATLVQVEEGEGGYALRREGRTVTGQDAFGAPFLMTSSSK